MVFNCRRFVIMHFVVRLKHHKSEISHHRTKMSYCYEALWIWEHKFKWFTSEFYRRAMEFVGLYKYKRITLSVYISHPRLSHVQGSEYFRYLTPQLPKIGAHSTQHYFENILFERGNVLQLCRQSRPVELAHYL